MSFEQQLSEQTEQRPIYACVIIGAGPNGLAMLSRLRETPVNSEFRIRGTDRNRKGRGGNLQPIAVVDESGEWLKHWKDSFANLGIQFLRSPIRSHPDFRDQDSFLSHIVLSGAQALPADFEIRGRGEDYNFSFAKPENRSFLEFSTKIAQELDHDFYKSGVVDIEEGHDGSVLVHLSDGSLLRAGAVVFALGQGPPKIPQPFETLYNDLKAPVIHSSHLLSQMIRESMNVLVIGGGSSSAQCALLCSQNGANVTLCSRRALDVKSFSLSSDWVHPYRSGALRFHFYSLKPKDRYKFLQEHLKASVSFEDYARLLQDPKILLKTGSVKKLIFEEGSAPHVEAIFRGEAKPVRFDLVVCATGFSPESMMSTSGLLRSFYSRYFSTMPF